MHDQEVGKLCSEYDFRSVFKQKNVLKILCHLLKLLRLKKPNTATPAKDSKPQTFLEPRVEGIWDSRDLLVDYYPLPVTVMF